MERSENQEEGFDLNQEGIKEQNSNGASNNEQNENKDSAEAKPVTDSKTTTEASDENMDISTPCWFYMDSDGLRQGPFSFKEMFLWWKGGYFPSDLPVRRIWEDEFSLLGHIPAFYNASAKLIERIEKEQEELFKKGQIEIPVEPIHYDEPIAAPTPEASTKSYEEYSVVGTFNPLNGKFQKEDSGSYFSAKGVPLDRAMRQMSHYFDPEAYQQQMNEAKAKGAAKKKQPKGTKKFWKERKEKKRRAKLLAEYLAD